MYGISQIRETDIKNDMNTEFLSKDKAGLLIKRKFWTWILSITFFIVMSISTFMTLINYQYINIVELLDFPKLEKDIFMKLPIKSSYILIAINGILLFTILFDIKTKNYYTKERKQSI